MAMVSDAEDDGMQGFQAGEGAGDENADLLLSVNVPILLKVLPCASLL